MPDNNNNNNNNNNNFRLEENNDDDDDVPHWLSQVRISKHTWHFSFFVNIYQMLKSIK